MPFAWIAIAFAAGIFAAKNAGLPPAWWGIALVVSAGIGAGILIGRKSPLLSRLGWRIPSTRLPVCLLPAIIALGGLLYQLALPHNTPDRLFAYNGQPVAIEIEAQVVDLPDYRANSTLVVLKSTWFSVDGAAYPGGERLMAVLPANTQIAYGDRLILLDRVETPFEDEDFSYREYLATRRIFSIISYPRIHSRTPSTRMFSWLFKLKASLVDVNRHIFRAPESGLITGILLGPRNDIPGSVYDAFRATGTSHIIAISGFNIAILAALIATVCLRAFGQWRGALIAVVVIAMYTVLTGASASVVRAAVMGSLAILARLIGRRQTGVNTLCLTAFAMLLVNPLLLWDVGFQLSFFATLGLVWFAAPMQGWFSGVAAGFIPQRYVARITGWVGEYFLFTLAAQATTLPLLITYFHRAPLATLVANPLILPAQPLLMVISGAAMLAGAVWLPLGIAAGFLAWPFAAYTIRIVEWIAGWNLPSIQVGQIHPAVPVVLYLLMVLFIYVPGMQGWLKKNLSPAALLLATAMITAAFTRFAAGVPDGRLHIHLGSEKSAGAVLLESPTGRFVLVNGGEDSDDLVAFAGRRLPFMRHVLDVLLLAPGSSADIKALPGALQQLSPGWILTAGELGDTGSADAILAAAGKAQIRVVTGIPGDTLDLGEGAELQLISIGDESRVIRVDWQDFAMLLVYGDELTERLPGANVVYTRENANQPEFTQQPQVWISGDGETRDATGIESHGWLEISTDGQNIWVEGEH